MTTLRRYVGGSALALAMMLSVPGSAAAQELDVTEEPVPGYRVWTVAELGFNSPVYHKIQFGRAGTYFDYVDEGGQDVLFPFMRLSVEAKFKGRHNLVFLYQPLEIETRVLNRRDVEIDGATFDEGTPMTTRYSFPFYRLSYMYDLFKSEKTELGVGASLQIRNATISFESNDGELYRVRRDVGPVPILKVRGRHTLENGVWFGAEIDGFYAPGQWVNGSTDTEVLGAILDASVRAGLVVTPEIDAFLNVRYLGGGADGTSPDQAEEGPGDGYTKNWLNLVIVSLGFNYNLF
ncbi:hypothetical protein DL240_14370 [Lujinxingia litoralis]|uniref:MipA/OmpV family protein n=1 Tax=Lujinxingia litoralis TaxID=2211119 RepID=A0A328C3E3_9DELT|nr:hypothetical protein [Lujinxingia litoralis]RAL21012.1 hypothetical protein DL240_14370 [Lujinxingia litoralis]